MTLSLRDGCNVSDGAPVTVWRREIRLPASKRTSFNAVVDDEEPLLTGIQRVGPD